MVTVLLVIVVAFGVGIFLAVSTVSRLARDLVTPAAPTPQPVSVPARRVYVPIRP
ncbi:hypothetical protein [Deinococcus pimensis]|uniref:hypothetical protein n=1 Tax=Deinococcus pimensis TaxID=309888 RepID=UPI0004B311F2|nr:hypothetical protein [Deinococcus pimensis]